MDSQMLDHSLHYIWPEMKKLMLNSSPQKGLGENDFGYLLTKFLVFSFCLPELLLDKEEKLNDIMDNFAIIRLFGLQWCEMEYWYKFPIIRRFFPNYSGYSKAKCYLNKGYDYLKEIVQIHEKTFNEEDHPRDFIDVYLQKLEKMNSDVFQGEDGLNCLVATLDNILVGGDGIILGFNYVLYFLTMFPDVQEEIYHELLENNLENGFPSLEEDKRNLQYLKAFLMETQRYGCQTGFGTPHTSDQTIQINGFKIPANTDVFPSILHVHFDSEYWDEPKAFKPSRFLDPETGKCISFHPQYIPFEVGPRMCPGRDIGMNALTLFTIKIVQEFQLLKINTELEPSNEFLGMMICQPQNMKIYFKPRNNSENVEIRSI